MSLHRCIDAECPHVGQMTDRGCRCHKTDEQVLREQRDELLEALQATVAEKCDYMLINKLGDPEQQHNIKLARAAIAKATGAA